MLKLEYKPKGSDNHPFVNCACGFLWLEAATRGVLYEKGVLRNFAKFTWKHLCRNFFLGKVADITLQPYSKRTLAQMFSWEFCKFFKKSGCFWMGPVLSTLRGIDGFFINKYLAKLMTLLMSIFQILKNFWRYQ